MPADREPHNAFGQPTGLWPGQDIPRQVGGPSLPWPEAESAPPPPPARPGGDLPWPERDRPDAGHHDGPGHDPAGWDAAPGTTNGWAPQQDGPWPQHGPAGHGDAAWPQGEPHDDAWATQAGPADGHTGWAPHDEPGRGPAGDFGPGGPAGEAGWGAGTTATATLTGPPPVDVPHGPATGGPGRPPAPPLAPAPAPSSGGSRRRWRVALAAALVLAVAGSGVAVATLRPDAAERQAGGTPGSVGPATSMGPGTPGTPGASPSADQGLGGKPSARPSASADAGPAFSGTRLTLPGASIGVQGGETFGQALARSDQTFGKLRMARIFFPGLPPAWSGSRADVVDRTVVVSFKASPQEVNTGKFDSRLTSWFSSIPREHNVYWSYFHEPEDDVERGAFSTTAYRTAWKRIAGLADRTGNPKLINTLILMCWTLDSKSGRSFDAFYPGGDVIEALGWDCYNWGKKWKRYASPQEIYGPMISKSKALGKPWGVAETGSDLVPGDGGTGRAAWIRSMTSFLNGQRPEFVAYYNQTVSQGDFRLLDQPSIQAWKSFCTA
ncbi:hypothetical protein ACFWDZ_23410 [Micromonospora aurantiaca]|uniref:GH26 domain-containing protein n=1 Tax=Micromonospora aurantiaca (nom. illeg.) TaxID=47850 RepID=A0A6N3JWH0_9ACTN|nr:hypothetical protein [Micromonospora aurantiaca]AXH89762.1 hypothetical protein DVH21_07365 [Micromonospora aurantiaca]